MRQELTPEQRRARIEGITKIVLLGIIGLLVGPFIFLAIKGLVGLVVAVVVGFTAIQFTPVVATMIANWRLRLLKAEAARNPVETLQNDYRQRQAALAQFHDAIAAFGAEVGNFEDKLAGFKKQYPEEADKFDDQLDQMKQLLKLRLDKYKQANKNLADYDKEIDKASAIWDMGLAAAKMNKASGAGDGDFLAKIMKGTALDAVQRSMNTAFSDLQLSLVDEEADQDKRSSKTKQLPAAPKMQTVDVDLQPLNVRELVKGGSR